METQCNLPEASEGVTWSGNSNRKRVLTQRIHVEGVFIKENKSFLEGTPRWIARSMLLLPLCMTRCKCVGAWLAWHRL